MALAAARYRRLAIRPMPDSCVAPCMENRSMTIQALLAELEQKHRVLEIELEEARVHPSVDNLRIVELKRQKLLLKDEIERLRHQPVH